MAMTMATTEQLVTDPSAPRAIHAPLDDQLGEDVVWIDEDGLLHRGGRWVVLPDIEWRLLELFVASFGRVVRRDDLTAAGWPDREVLPSALNVRINLARQRLAPLDLVITTVRGRGYVLSRAPG